MTTHENIVTAAYAGQTAGFNLTSNDVHISYLPLAHMFERMAIVLSFFTGMRVGFYQGDVLKLREDLAELRPTVMPSVPRLLNRIYDVIQSRLKEATGMRKRLAEWAISTKLAYLNN